MVEVDCVVGVSILLFSARTPGAPGMLPHVFGSQIERDSARHTRIVANHRFPLRVTHLNGDKR